MRGANRMQKGIPAYLLTRTEHESSSNNLTVTNHPPSLEHRSMASKFALRRMAIGVSTRSFHASACSFIRVGEKLPNLDVLVESSPGNKVNLSDSIKGKALLIGVPAAFSMLDSSHHWLRF